MFTTLLIIYAANPAGGAGTAYALYTSNKAKRAQDQLLESNNQQNKQLESIQNQNSMILDFINNKSKLLDLNFYKGIDYLFNIPSYWDKITIILCFNMFASFNLMSLGISFLLGRYENILIEKFKLEQRFPRL